MFKFKNLFSRQPKPQDFWSMRQLYVEPSEGAFANSGELITSLAFEGRGPIFANNLNNKSSLGRIIETTQGIDDQKRKLFFNELDRLFDVKALAEQRRKEIKERIESDEALDGEKRKTYLEQLGKMDIKALSRLARE